MEFEPKSIADQIECLAQLTGAPESFIMQVRALFEKKGISLLTDATPYVAALEQAFKREHSIRTSTQRARQSLRQTQKNFAKIGEAYVRQARKLRRLNEPAAKPDDDPSRRTSTDPGGRSVTIQGDHRTYVAPRQRERYPMVPGPEEIQ
jgi:hypothetical protein